MARLLSELREENRELWREVRSLSSRIPQLVSPATGHGPATALTNFMGSSQSSQSHISPHAQIGLGGGHVHSRPSSNMGGDDGERDADWEDDDGMSASMCSGPMTGIAPSMGGSQGGEEWETQNSRFDFQAGAGLNVPGFPSNTFGPASGDDWKRWAQGEIIKERKRVQRLVGVVKALVDGSSKGGANAGPASNGNVALGVNMDGEPDGSKFLVLSQFLYTDTE